MLPTTLPDPDLLLPWIAEDMRSALMESRARARQVCQEAHGACVAAVALRQETVRLCHSAALLRAVNAPHRAEGVRRRQPGA